MDLASALFWITLRIAEMQRPRIAETVVVVDGGPTLAVPTAVTVLRKEALDASPAATVDDALRSIPGFSLFRRSSSRVANPTTQGATLRGLAASGSSRALVLADGVPLNDPVGGWVNWNRVPVAALQEVWVARGAAGDLHGADAVGGVIDLVSAASSQTRVLVDGGDDGTARVSAMSARDWGEGGFFASAEAAKTDGFVIVAPESRGSIDTRAGSRYTSAHAGARGSRSGHFWLVRGSHFRESRKNGTPFQRNSTRVTVASGEVGASWRLRPYVQVQDYEQTFSAVLAGRVSERATSEQQIGATAFGATLDVPPLAGLDIGFSAKRASADLTETTFATNGTRLTPATIEPRQFSLSASAQRRWWGRHLDAGAGARIELWQSTLDEANRHVFFNPRLWTTAKAGAFKVNLSLQSGFRGPTINELYRPFRVGNTVTDANAMLKPEAVHGVEAGLSRSHGRTSIRLLGFFSRVDDAIVNVTLSSSGGTILRQRQNAARIHARGFELETETRVGPMFSELLVLTTSTSFTKSDFATGPLEGLRVPQVPQWHHAIGGRGVIGRAKWSAEWRYIDEQFDDDRNVFPLDPSSMLDARVGWMVTKKVELFGAMENATDEEQDVGRTPIRTIGLPRTTRVGVRVVF